MALTLTKEDGTGKVDANSYAAVADADSYFEGHLYASAWTAATATTKAAALVMATRLVDSQYQFNGFRAHDTQALQWPRERCPDPDRNLVTSTTLSPVLTNFVPSTLVPQGVASAVGHLKPLGKPMQNARKWFATCELDRLSQDRDWLDKAIRIMEKHVQDANRKQRGKAPDGCQAPLERSGQRAELN